MTFQLHFLLISIIFINKMPINASQISKALIIASTNFLSYNKLNEHQLGCFPHHSSWNTCPIIVALYIFTWNFTRAVTEPPPLQGTSSSMFNNTYNQQDYWKENILPMELYNIARCSIYNDNLLKHDKHTIYWRFITQLIMVFTIHICTYKFASTNK